MERASVFEAPFLGAESLADPGTAVVANKQLEAIGFARKPKMENKPFTPKGFKVPTLMVPGKEWTEWAVDGVADFNNIIYPLASVIATPSIAVVGTNARDWTFNSAASGPDLCQTYTIDVGSAVRADRASNVVFTEFGMAYTRDAVSLTGAAIGKLFTDNVDLTGVSTYTINLDSGTVSGGTFTATVTAVATGNLDWDITAAELQLALGALSTVGHGNVLVTGGPLPASFTVKFFGDLFGTAVTMTVDDALLTGATPVVTAASESAGAAVSTVAGLPVAPGNTSIFIDGLAANFGTTRHLRILQADLAISGRREMLWPIDANQTSWATTYETAIDATLKVKMVADSVGMGYLVDARDASTNFVRIESTGADFDAPDAAFSRRLRVDIAGKIEMPDDMGGEGVTTVDWSLRLVNDATWENWIEVEVRNNLTSL